MMGETVGYIYYMKQTGPKLMHMLLKKENMPRLFKVRGEKDEGDFIWATIWSFVILFPICIP